jgi:hypothetical protein
MTIKQKMKPSFNSAQNNRLAEAFYRYQDSVKTVLKLASSNDNKAQLALHLKETNILWDNVVSIRGADGPLGDGICRYYRGVNLKLAAVMNEKGITARDVAEAQLYTTSTGRKTAAPQFKRRFD